MIGFKFHPWKLDPQDELSVNMRDPFRRVSHDLQTKGQPQYAEHSPNFLLWESNQEPVVGYLSPSETLRERLLNANDYFRRKASEVFNDDAALRLLSEMHQRVVVDIPELPLGEEGLALAKLTAANFCEIGAKVIYITQAGQRFIESIEGTWSDHTTPSGIGYYSSREA